jgi:hypothetical protein
MIVYPEVQRRAQEEIDKVTGGTRLPTIDEWVLFLVRSALLYSWYFLSLVILVVYWQQSGLSSVYRCADSGDTAMEAACSPINASHVAR